MSDPGQWSSDGEDEREMRNIMAGDGAGASAVVWEEPESEVAVLEHSSSDDETVDDATVRDIEADTEEENKDIVEDEGENGQEGDGFIGEENNPSELEEEVHHPDRGLESPKVNVTGMKSTNRGEPNDKTVPKSQHPLLAQQNARYNSIGNQSPQPIVRKDYLKSGRPQSAQLYSYDEPQYKDGQTTKFIAHTSWRRGQVIGGTDMHSGVSSGTVDDRKRILNAKGIPSIPPFIKATPYISSIEPKVYEISGRSSNGLSQQLWRRNRPRSAVTGKPLKTSELFREKALKRRTARLKAQAEAEGRPFIDNETEHAKKMKEAQKLTERARPATASLSRRDSDSSYSAYHSPYARRSSVKFSPSSQRRPQTAHPDSNRGSQDQPEDLEDALSSGPTSSPLSSPSQDQRRPVSSPVNQASPTTSPSSQGNRRVGRQRPSTAAPRPSQRQPVRTVFTGSPARTGFAGQKSKMSARIYGGQTHSPLATSPTKLTLQMPRVGDPEAEKYEVKSSAKVLKHQDLSSVNLMESKESTPELLGHRLSKIAGQALVYEMSHLASERGDIASPKEIARQFSPMKLEQRRYSFGRETSRSPSPSRGVESVQFTRGVPNPSPQRPSSAVSMYGVVESNDTYNTDSADSDDAMSTDEERTAKMAVVEQLLIQADIGKRQDDELCRVAAPMGSFFSRQQRSDSVASGGTPPRPDSPGAASPHTFALWTHSPMRKNDDVMHINDINRSVTTVSPLTPTTWMQQTTSMSSPSRPQSALSRPMSASSGHMPQSRPTSALSRSSFMAPDIPFAKKVTRLRGKGQKKDPKLVIRNQRVPGSGLTPVKMAPKSEWVVPLNEDDSGCESGMGLLDGAGEMGETDSRVSLNLEDLTHRMMNLK